MRSVDLKLRLPGLRGHRVHVVPAADEGKVRAALTGAGFEIVTLAGSAITNVSTLFEEMARAFRFPDYFGHNWAALLDCLRDLRDRENTRIALLWVDAGASLEADLQTFLDASEVLVEVASELAEDDEFGEAHQLEVFLLGAGPGFAASA
ncbi:MAG TPA: barstar family protein [Vicinamibacteria bacterium]|nr:barstar family protein [Vicinamibacteria bacterium]